MSRIRSAAFLRVAILAVAFCCPSASSAGDWPPYVLEWPQRIGDILIAETDTYTLHRVRRDRDGSVSVESHPMSIGQLGAGKRREGDLKTPFGVYFVVDRIDTTPLHPKYGSVAFPVDYPNARDRQLGRSGGGIWLHGVLPGTATPIPRDTDGCIALNNAVLDSLAEVIDVQLTPLIVTRQIAPAAPATGREAVRDELDGRVASWAASLERGALHDYLAHYDPGFSYLGLDLDDWSVLQFDALAAEEVAGVTVSDLFSAADPDEAGLYVTRFRLEVTLRDGSSRTQWKRLYWQRDDSGVLLIVAEDEA